MLTGKSTFKRQLINTTYGNVKMLISRTTIGAITVRKTPNRKTQKHRIPSTTTSNS